jgi:hypothetical protein
MILSSTLAQGLLGGEALMGFAQRLRTESSAGLEQQPAFSFLTEALVSLEIGS